MRKQNVEKISATVAAVLVTFSVSFVYSQGPKVMIFSDDGDNVYLGCLSCNKYEPDSLSNNYGSHGNKYSSESIFNNYGAFGSKYSGYSACNPYASNPPVIVDENGDFYGHLSTNIAKNQGIEGTDYEEWLEVVVCGD